MSARSEQTLSSAMQLPLQVVHAEQISAALEKCKVPCYHESESTLRYDFTKSFLDITPMTGLTDYFEDLPPNESFSGRLNSLDSVSSHLDSGLNDELYLEHCAPSSTSGLAYCLDLGLEATDTLDDVFTASKEALGEGPTLAALNASELELDDLPLPEEISSHIRGSGLTTPSQDSQDCLSIPMGCGGIPPSNAAPVVQPLTLVKQEPIVGSSSSSKHTSLHELLLQNHSSVAHAPSVVPQIVAQNQVEENVKCEQPASSEDAGYELQTSQCCRWPRMRPRTSTLSSIESFADETVHSNASISESSQDCKTEGKDNESHDEGFDSDLEDSDHYDCSDAESVSSWDANHNSCSPTPPTKTRKKERYFWQYNLQAKGPKGHRMPLSTDPLDPHLLDEVTDPVFSPTCQVQGIKHTGKARRGDGNDLTPNPSKLYQIGQELKKLNKVINDLTPVSELPFNVRPKSRKEKNKLASRACRLKKKAQHEANKLKLFGLEQEHKRLMYVLAEMKKSVIHHVNKNTLKRGELSQRYEHLAKNCLKTKVAGNSVEFVNMVLERVPAGESSSFLEQL